MRWCECSIVTRFALTAFKADLQFEKYVFGFHTYDEDFLCRECFAHKKNRNLLYTRLGITAPWRAHPRTQAQYILALGTQAICQRTPNMIGASLAPPLSGGGRKFTNGSKCFSCVGSPGELGLSSLVRVVRLKILGVDDRKRPVTYLSWCQLQVGLWEYTGTT